MDKDAATAMVKENIGLLEQAEKLITDLNDPIYTDNQVPPYQSGVGKHFRHVLDFYRAFLNRAYGCIDYDVRGRSTAVETSRKKALEAIGQITQELRSLQNSDQPIRCKNDDGGHRRPEQAFSESTIGRELQFLASHSVHHYAIIAMILLQHGITPPRGFGVAASTWMHWRETGDERYA